MSYLDNQYERIIKKIISFLLSAQLISENEIEIYYFGIEVMLLKMIHIASYFFLVYVFNINMTDFTIVFTIFCFLRTNAGGAHAETRVGCYIFSCCMVVVVAHIMQFQINRESIIAIIIVDVLLLYFMAPVQNKNRELDKDDSAYFRKKLFVVNVVFLVLCICLISFKKNLFWLYTVGLSTETFLVVVGRIQNTIGREEGVKRES